MFTATYLDFQRNATVARRAPGDWIKAAEAGSADLEIEALTQQDVWSEYLMMGLRLSEGIDLERARMIDPARTDALALDPLVELGLIWRDEARFGATQQGRLLLNTLTAELL